MECNGMENIFIPIKFLQAKCKLMQSSQARYNIWNIAKFSADILHIFWPRGVVLLPLDCKTPPTGASDYGQVWTPHQNLPGKDVNNSDSNKGDT